jgi:hypothetical protein
MPKQNAKLLLTSTDNKQFIFFQNSKAAMLFQVFRHTSRQSALDQQEYLQKYHQYHNLQFLSTITGTNRDAVLIASVRIFPGSLSPDLADIAALTPAVNRLADWYRFTYLVPTAKKEPLPPPDSNLL